MGLGVCQSAQDLGRAGGPGGDRARETREERVLRHFGSGQQGLLAPHAALGGQEVGGARRLLRLPTRMRGKEAGAGR